MEDDVLDYFLKGIRERLGIHLKRVILFHGAGLLFLTNGNLCIRRLTGYIRKFVWTTGPFIQQIMSFMKPGHCYSADCLLPWQSRR